MRTPANDLLFHTWNNPPHTLPALQLTGWYNRKMLIEPSSKKPRKSWVIDYSLNRHGLVRVGNGEWQPRLPGIAHIYPPHTSYGEDTLDTRHRLKGGYAVFTGGEILGLPHYLRPGCRYIRIQDPGRRLAIPLQEIARAGHYYGDEGYWQGLSIFLRLIDLLRSLQFVEGETFLLPVAASTQSEEALPTRLRAFLLEHLAEKLTLQHLASALHTSPSTLSHQCRKETGLSPIQALIELRLNKVEALLRTSLTLEEIAHQTGFYDAFHLSKIFKQYRGSTPRPRG